MADKPLATRVKEEVMVEHLLLEMAPLLQRAAALPVPDSPLVTELLDPARMELFKELKAIAVLWQQGSVQATPTRGSSHP